MISITDFQNIELRIGTILNVEVVPDADKLLKLTVLFGEEERTIVSGIRSQFPEPEMLINRQATFITNLAPRMLKGIESNGMILAASHDGTIALLEPTSPVPPGTRIS
jgi:methionyl-tRNA synthetase